MVASIPHSQPTSVAQDPRVRDPSFPLISEATWEEHFDNLIFDCFLINRQSQ